MSGLQTNAATVGLFVPGDVRCGSLNGQAGFGTVITATMSNSAFVVAVPGMTATGKAIAWVSKLDTAPNLLVESCVAAVNGVNIILNGLPNSVGEVSVLVLSYA